MSKRCSTVVARGAWPSWTGVSTVIRQENLDCRGPLANAGASRLRPRPTTRSVSTVGCVGPPRRRMAAAWLWRLAARVRRMRLYIGPPYLEGSRKISSRRHGEAVESDFRGAPARRHGRMNVAVPMGMRRPLSTMGGTVAALVGRWPIRGASKSRP